MLSVYCVPAGGVSESSLRPPGSAGSHRPRCGAHGTPCPQGPGPRPQQPRRHRARREGEGGAGTTQHTRCFVQSLGLRAVCPKVAPSSSVLCRTGPKGEGGVLIRLSPKGKVGCWPRQEVATPQLGSEAPAVCTEAGRGGGLGGRGREHRPEAEAAAHSAALTFTGTNRQEVGPAGAGPSAQQPGCALRGG